VADTTQDLVKSDPIETLKQASKISMQGGGALFFAVILAVVMMNADPKWAISNGLVLAALIGAVLLGLAGTAARMYDAHLRVKLAVELIKVKGTSDAKKAEELPALGTSINGVLGTPVMYLVRPDPSGGAGQ